MLVGTYNPWLVAISLLVAVMASYTALAMAGRTVTAPGKGAAWWWRLGGGFAMGLGIWSMHFIGMLAFDLPIPLGYDLPITLLSLAWPSPHRCSRCGWSRCAPCPTRAGRRRAADGHRHCRHALRWHGGDAHAAGHRLRPGLAAVLADGGGGRLVDRAVRGVPPARAAHPCRRPAGSAGLLGLAIVGMHYTGMAAARFPEGSICGAAVGDGLQNEWLAMLVVVLTVAILAVVLVVSWLDQREAQLLRLRNSMLSTR
jgi:NO-binding membrane sensor protein with MHYT domain